MRISPFAAAASFLLVIGFFVFLCSVLQGCGGAPVVEDLPPFCEGTEIASTSQYIVNGTPSTDQRNTVQVTACTGTIVGPHTVLSAAHCPDDGRVFINGWPYPWYEVTETLEHPDAWGVGRHDLQLLYVEEELPLDRIATLAAYQGCTSLLAQGYGQGSDGELHEREVSHIWRGHGILMTTEATCYGDSGGPLYACQEDGTCTVVAVTSFGTTEDCYDGGQGFVDLTQDGNLEWVQENIR